MKLIFNPSRDGWSVEDFHRLCDDQGPTILFIKSRAGNICGGYASISWKSKESSPFWGSDSRSFVFSIDERTTYKPSNPNKALYHNKDWGPSFGGYSLSLHGKMMNQPFQGICFTIGEGKGNNIYDIPEDFLGNSIITGQGLETEGRGKRFTCVALEVYKVIF